MTKLQEIRGILINLLLEEYAEAKQLKASKLYNPNKQEDVKEEVKECVEQ
jgi:hypothetical protein